MVTGIYNRKIEQAGCLFFLKQTAVNQDKEQQPVRQQALSRRLTYYLNV